MVVCPLCFREWLPGSEQPAGMASEEDTRHGLGIEQVAEISKESQLTSSTNTNVRR